MTAHVHADRRRRRTDVAARAARSLLRRLSGWLHAHRRVQLGLLLATPLGWLVVVYLGSLFILLLNAFWDEGLVHRQGRSPFDWSLDAFETLLEQPVYRTIALRTHRHGRRWSRSPTRSWRSRSPTTWPAIASPRKRGMLVIAVLMPLWAAYLVKVYAWRTILQGNGLARLGPRAVRDRGPGPRRAIANSWLVLSYLWLPYMILPLYAGLERIPSSLLEASADLGGRGLDDVPAGGPAAVVPGARRGLDLHVLADARRLHHARPRVRREVHRQRHLRQLEPRQPAPRRGVLARPDRRS